MVAPGTLPPANTAPAIIVPPAARTTTVVVPPGPNVPPAAIVQPIEVMPGPIQPAAPLESLPSPLLDGREPAEYVLPPVDEDSYCGEGYEGGARGVRPYGGGRPADWSWGCGGSPYRTVGRCDNWRVGPKWHVTVDGIVMTRYETDLEALTEEMIDNHLGEEDLENPTFEQFDRGPGGRITFTSQVPRYAGYQIQFAYEGIEAWNSSIVFEKEDFEPEFYTAVITTTTTTTTTVVNPPPSTIVTTETTTTNTYDDGPLPLQPGDPFPEGSEQRSLHYRSNYHSGELNFLVGHNSTWQPYCGVRYINFDDEINDTIDQQAQPPLPFEGPDNVPPGEFLAVATTDRVNLFDIQNNLMGFQLGLFHDSWQANRRLAFEGFVNGGVYYNKIKYTNLMGIFTTQQITDDTSTTGINESRIDFSNTVNNDVREYSEVSYVGEASLSGVCRLNKCWALRGGYQALWIANLHLADDAYLGNENANEDLFFHGWHAGVECRR